MLKTKKQNKKKKGFTLIELIVVLAVLAIIALIAIPNFNKIRENSKIKSDESSSNHIDQAVTLLVQSGDIKEDGTYEYNGSTVAKATGSTGTNDYSNVISGVLGTTSNLPQENGKTHYEIKIENATTANPTVKVETK